MLSGAAATSAEAVWGNWDAYERTVARMADGGSSEGGSFWEAAVVGEVWKRVGLALSVGVVVSFK